VIEFRSIRQQREASVPRNRSRPESCNEDTIGPTIQRQFFDRIFHGLHTSKEQTATPIETNQAAN
jgi:hypothetical protein